MRLRLVGGSVSVRAVNLKLGGVFLLVCLLAAPPIGAAQDEAARKRAAVKKLVEVTRMGAASAQLFNELVTRYQQHWADSVIKDFRARGLLRPYSAKDAARIELLIREMGDNIFDEIRQRTAREIYTDEFMFAIGGVPLEKLLTADELESLLAFFETPTGKKLVSTSSRLLRETIVASFEERGFFQLLSSAEEETARITRLTAEMKSRPLVQPEQIMAAWRALPPDYFSVEEKLQLVSFVTTPAALKVGENFPAILREMMANIAPHTPRMGQLAMVVFKKHTGEFGRKLNELKIVPAQGRTGRGRKPRH